MMRIGLDVGSTTLKCIVLNDQNEIIYKDYERHYSQITEKAASMLRSIARHFPQEKQAQLCISGSAGMGFAESMGIPFTGLLLLMGNVTFVIYDVAVARIIGLYCARFRARLMKMH